MEATLSLVLGVILAGSPGEPNWLGDYGAALQAAQSQSRPLLVVIDNPSQSATRVEQVAWKGGPQEDELLNPYKLCHVDVTTPYGMQVAKAFKATTVPHTVIIDKTGSVQIFKRTGRFSQGEWQATLAKYRTGVRQRLIERRPVVCFT